MLETVVIVYIFNYLGCKILDLYLILYDYSYIQTDLQSSFYVEKEKNRLSKVIHDFRLLLFVLIVLILYLMI